MTDESDAAIVASHVLGAFPATPGATDCLRRYRRDLLHACVFVSPIPRRSARRRCPRLCPARDGPADGPGLRRERARDAQPDGTLMLEVDGEFADIRRLILAVFYEGFSGLHVEVTRPEMLAALEHLYPFGLSASTRDVRGLSYWL